MPTEAGAEVEAEVEAEAEAEAEAAEEAEGEVEACVLAAGKRASAASAGVVLLAVTVTCGGPE